MNSGINDKINQAQYSFQFGFRVPICKFWTPGFFLSCINALQKSDTFQYESNGTITKLKLMQLKKQISVHYVFIPSATPVSYLHLVVFTFYVKEILR